MKLWRRWDPRFERMPLLEVRDASRWLIEIVPDLFEPGAEVLREQVFETIEKVRGQYKGRFMVRTAFPGVAIAALRQISDAREHRPVLSRLVLAVYAETQAELDARIEETFAPRVMVEDLALADPDAALALATQEGLLLLDSDRKAAKTARREGAEALAKFLAGKAAWRGRPRSAGIPVDSGGLALYLRPRERIDIWPLALPRIRALRGCYPQETFNWIVLSGAMGPISMKRKPAEPWPMHPHWITEIAATARLAQTPFCIPYLGEWTHYDQRKWVGDSLDGGNMSSNDALEPVPTACVNYDPTWEWMQHGWDGANPGRKPSDAYMHAAGSKLVGRALGGRIFDEWPEWWVAR